MSLGERAKLTIAPYTAPAPPVAVGIGADMGVCLVTMGPYGARGFPPVLLGSLARLTLTLKRSMMSPQRYTRPPKRKAQHRESSRVNVKQGVRKLWHRWQCACDR
jgi:hypothetical protein